MAILTVSRQFGSRGDDLARQLARRTGFRLIDREAVEHIMRERYGIEPGSGPIGSDDVLYADLFAAIVAEIAAHEHIVLVGRGGQFLFRDAPCAMHLRVVAPRAWRAATVAAEMRLAPPAASQLVTERDAAQARYLRAVFRRSAQSSDLYHLVLNTAALDFDHAVDLALDSVDSAMLSGAGMLPPEAVRRLKIRSKIVLARHFAGLPGSAMLERVNFAHPSERVFARLLDFYKIEWEYEPRTFPIEWNEDGSIAEAFTPDFYLPELDLYVELTTMKQSLVTRKNRKVKRLRELHPDINIRIFYQKDIEDLIFKLGGHDAVVDPRIHIPE